MKAASERSIDERASPSTMKTRCERRSSSDHAAMTRAPAAPPTGKSTRSDYVYCMAFDGDKIRHMTKIWNAGWAMHELGWG